MMMPKKRLLITTLVIFLGSSILNATILLISPKKIELIESYFTEVKIESLIYLFIGLISFLCSLIFWLIIKYSFYKGIAIPFRLWSFLLIYNGYHQFETIEKQKSTIEQFLNAPSPYSQTNEIDQINITLVHINQYNWITWIILTGGFMLLFLDRASSQKFWKGFGFGLIISACIMLILNKITESHMLSYQTLILSLV